MKKKSEQPGSPGRTRVSRRGFFGTAAAGVAGSTILPADAKAAQAAARPPAAGKATSQPAIASGAVPLVDIALNVNGRPFRLPVEPRWTLLYVLRERLGLTGTKPGCERGECGACTVLIDGVARYSCMTLAVEAEGAQITTIEGLMRGGELGPVQQAFVEEDGYQCGYCTPGQVMAVEGLLRKTPDPGVEQVRDGVSGNLCRCGAYAHIFKAGRRAAELRRKQENRA